MSEVSDPEDCHRGRPAACDRPAGEYDTRRGNRTPTRPGVEQSSARHIDRLAGSIAIRVDA